MTEANDRCEILITVVLVLLRRLPDDIFKASGPLLFEKWGAVPQSFRQMIAAAKKGTLARFNPTCDLSHLTAILTAAHPWFDNLANHPGIRDVLVHMPHAFHVGATGSQKEGKDVEWAVDAQLCTWTPHDGIKTVNALTIVVECVTGVCDFMTSFYQCLAPNDTYHRDFIFLTGNDIDSVGFWPSIEGHPAVFPMADDQPSSLQ